jgi:hypothetical protein
MVASGFHRRRGDLTQPAHELAGAVLSDRLAIR